MMIREAAGNRDEASGRARKREGSDAVLPSKQGNRECLRPGQLESACPVKERTAPPHWSVVAKWKLSSWVGRASDFMREMFV